MRKSRAVLYVLLSFGVAASLTIGCAGEDDGSNGGSGGTAGAGGTVALPVAQQARDDINGSGRIEHVHGRAVVGRRSEGKSQGASEEAASERQAKYDLQIQD